MLFFIREIENKPKQVGCGEVAPIVWHALQLLLEGRAFLGLIHQWQAHLLRTWCSPSLLSNTVFQPRTTNHLKCGSCDCNTRFLMNVNTHTHICAIMFCLLAYWFTKTSYVILTLLPSLLHNIKQLRQFWTKVIIKWKDPIIFWIFHIQKCIAGHRVKEINSQVQRTLQ